MTHDVFISYSTRDKQSADAACAAMEARGVRVWIAPRDVVPGSEWAGSIVDAIGSCKAMILVFSDHANRSPQIKNEVERAVHHGIPIIPLRIENVVPSKSLELFISTPHWLDAMTPPLQAHLDRLAETVELLLDRGKTSTSIEGDGASVSVDEAVAGTKERASGVESETGGLQPAAATASKPFWERGLVAGLVALLVIGLAVAAGVMTGGRGRRADALVARAVEQINTGYYFKALDTLSEAIELDDQNGEAYAYRALASSEDPDAAVEDAIKALRLMPDSVLAHVANATAFARRNDDETALAEAQVAVDLEPESHWARAALGAALASVNRFEEAEREHSYAMRLAPEIAPVYTTRATFYAETEEYEKCVADADKALKIGPKAPMALAIRAICRVNNNEKDLALEDANAALRSAPKSATCYFARAMTYLLRGESERALADAEQAVRLAPKLDEALVVRSLAYVHLGRIDEALADADRAVKLDASSSNAYLARGVARMNRGEYDKAIADFTSGLRIDPTEPEHATYRGFCHMGRGDNKAALVDLNRAIELKSTNYLTYTGRAGLMIAKGETDVARGDLQRALEVDRTGAQLDVAKIQIEQLGDFEAGLRNASAAVDHNGEDANATFWRGQALWKLNRYADARDAFAETVRIAPTNAHNHDWLAQAHQAVGDWEAALQEYDQAVAGLPGDQNVLTRRAAARIVTDRLEAAKLDLDSVLESQKDNAAQLWWRGRVSFWLGQWEAAKQDLTRAIELQPEQSWVYRVRALVNERLGRRKEAAADRRRAIELNPKLVLESAEVRITQVHDGKAGARYGLKANDVVLAYGGHRLFHQEDLVDRVNERGGKVRELRIRRDGETRTFEVEPGRLGVTLETVEK